jgi:hypothetical protein
MTASGGYKATGTPGSKTVKTFRNYIATILYTYIFSIAASIFGVTKRTQTVSVAAVIKLHDSKSQQNRTPLQQASEDSSEPAAQQS